MCVLDSRWKTISPEVNIGSVSLHPLFMFKEGIMGDHDVYQLVRHD